MDSREIWTPKEGLKVHHGCCTQNISEIFSLTFRKKNTWKEYSSGLRYPSFLNEMLKGFVRLRNFIPNIAVPISIWNITYSIPFGKPIALNRLAKEGLEILAQALAGKRTYRKKATDMHLGKLSQSKEKYLWYECLESPTQPQVWLTGMLS